MFNIFEKTKGVVDEPAQSRIIIKEVCEAEQLRLSEEYERTKGVRFVLASIGWTLRIVGVLSAVAALILVFFVMAGLFWTSILGVDGAEPLFENTAIEYNIE